MRSILLIDDDANIRMALREFLMEAGFVVHVAREGQHALHVLDKIDPPDLILLDYKMPVMDGKQSCHDAGQSATADDSRRHHVRATRNGRARTSRSRRC
jgi:DNA-binding response OmpR family regulator